MVQERYAYTAYGQVTVYDPSWSNPTQTSSVGNTRLFAGMDLDPLTGAYDDNARWYNYTTGTFVNRDPIGYRGGINLYEYCEDDPIRRTDSTGLGNNGSWASCVRNGSISIRSEFEEVEVHVGVSVWLDEPRGIQV